MALERIEIDLDTEPLPEAVAAFLALAEAEVDAFFDSGENRKVPRYLPSDSTAVAGALAAVTAADLPLGRVFLEWGCGFGVATGVAALLGYQAAGIEIEPGLAARAGALFASAGVDAQVVCGSFLPDGLETYDAQDGAALIPADGAGSGWVCEGFETPLDEVDLVFAYPWPGEQEMVDELFDLVACEGAVLLTYYGEGDLAAYRKVADG